MKFSATHYFSLIVPACALLQGVVLSGGWVAMRHRYLLWMAAANFLPAFALAGQTMMQATQLAEWALIAGTLYMAGLWAAAKGIADKFGVSAHPRLALCIYVIASSCLFYFSQVHDWLWMRILILNAALALLLALPLAGVLRQQRPTVFIERLLRVSAICLVVYAFIRLVAVAVVIPTDVHGEFTSSGYWLLMLACSLIISSWFTFVMLACAVKETFQSLQYERNHDPLTRLLNRRAFFEQAEIRMTATDKAQWGIIICDIDHFKRVNDTWGHAAGDLVLQMVGNTLLMQARQDDLVARFGGEEFVILLRCEDLPVAHAVADSMRLGIAQTVFPGMPDGLTASFGVAMASSDATIKHTITRADDLLYSAKKAGRNQVMSEGSSSVVMSAQEDALMQ